LQSAWAKGGEIVDCNWRETSIKAKVNVAELHDVIKYYNVLFGIFSVGFTITAGSRLKLV
jgi:hypothetical protein